MRRFRRWFRHQDTQTQALIVLVIFVALLVAILGGASLFLNGAGS